MPERETLEARIARAVHEVERTDAERRRRKSGLEGTLSRLEARFKARNQELDHTRARLLSLDDANREIETCIARLAELAERSATADSESRAALTLRLRTEMLPEGARFEDVSGTELEAEDAEFAGPGTAATEDDPDGDIAIPRIARGTARRTRH